MTKSKSQIARENEQALAKLDAEDSKAKSPKAPKAPKMVVLVSENGQPLEANLNGKRYYGVRLEVEKSVAGNLQRVLEAGGYKLTRE